MCLVGCRYAQCSASIEAPGKRDVANLSRYVAAYVPASSLSQTVVVHQFLHLNTQLIDTRSQVPQGWFRPPEICGEGARTTLSDASRFESLKRTARNTEAMREALSQLDYMKREGEPDWEYAARARFLLASRIKFDWPTSTRVNRGKPPASPLITRYGQRCMYGAARD